MLTCKDEVLTEMAARGIIIIHGEIDGEMVCRVRDYVTIAEANHVNKLEVRIRSGGGHVQAGLDIYDFLRSTPVATRTGIVYSSAKSIASIILQACETRFALRHAQLLIHYVYQREVSLAIMRDQTKLLEMIADAEANQSRIDTILMRRTHRTLEEIQAACARDTDMSAEEALEFGLIDAIRD